MGDCMVTTGGFLTNGTPFIPPAPPSSPTAALFPQQPLTHVWTSSQSRKEVIPLLTGSKNKQKGGSYSKPWNLYLLRPKTSPKTLKEPIDSLICYIQAS